MNLPVKIKEIDALLWSRVMKHMDNLVTTAKTDNQNTTTRIGAMTQHVEEFIHAFSEYKRWHEVYRVERPDFIGGEIVTLEVTEVDTGKGR